MQFHYVLIMHKDRPLVPKCDSFWGFEAADRNCPCRSLCAFPVSCNGKGDGIAWWYGTQNFFLKGEASLSCWQPIRKPSSGCLLCRKRCCGGMIWSSGTDPITGKFTGMYWLIEKTTPCPNWIGDSSGSWRCPSRGISDLTRPYQKIYNHLYRIVIPLSKRLWYYFSEEGLRH